MCLKGHHGIWRVRSTSKACADSTTLEPQERMIEQDLTRKQSYGRGQEGREGCKRMKEHGDETTGLGGSKIGGIGTCLIQFPLPDNFWSYLMGACIHQIMNISSQPNPGLQTLAQEPDLALGKPLYSLWPAFRPLWASGPLDWTQVKLALQGFWRPKKNSLSSFPQNQK